MQFLLNAARPINSVELVDTLVANGRILASEQQSTVNVPPMDNSQMDGYAVRSQDCVSGHALLPVSQRVPAGQVPQALQAGTTARIFTGAMLPLGADAIVMQEQCEQQADNVLIQHAPKSG